MSVKPTALSHGNVTVNRQTKNSKESVTNAIDWLKKYCDLAHLSINVH